MGPIANLISLATISIATFVMAIMLAVAWDMALENDWGLVALSFSIMLYQAGYIYYEMERRDAKSNRLS